MPVNKPCAVCGAIMINVAPKRRFCYECRAENQRQVSARWRANHREYATTYNQAYKTVKPSKKLPKLSAEEIKHNEVYGLLCKMHKLEPPRDKFICPGCEWAIAVGDDKYTCVRVGCERLRKRRRNID